MRPIEKGNGPAFGSMPAAKPPLGDGRYAA